MNIERFADLPLNVKTILRNTGLAECSMKAEINGDLVEITLTLHELVLGSKAGQLLSQPDIFAIGAVIIPQLYADRPCLKISFYHRNPSEQEL